MRRMYNPYVYRRKQYSAFSIVLLAVLVYVILERNIFVPAKTTTECITPANPDEFVGNEDAPEEKD